jgi:N-6 DNA Methylase/TaqI-like C-terminal specificity domain
MIADNPLNWYEAGLPTRERKVRGHFSTPPQLVEDMLDACGYTPDQDLSQLRVLDPACGSGNFLVGATKRLILSGQYARHATQTIATSIQRNIWGFDPDPVSCFLTEMHLHATYTHTISPSSQKTQISPLHIHQADALTLRWDETANVDLFLANPPYLAAKNNDLSGYRVMQSSGQIDSYLLFMRLALRVTRPHGWIGLVLPDPFLARTNASQTRRCLLAETTIHHLWHLAGVFAAGVGAVVIVAQKCLPKSFHAICWQRERWPTFLKQRVQQTSAIFDGYTVGTPLAASAAPIKPLSVRNKRSMHASSINAQPYTQTDAASGVPTVGQDPSCNRALSADAASGVPTKSGYVAQTLLLNQPCAELRYLLNEVQGTLVERLHNQFQSTNGQQHLRPLDDFVVIRRGEEIGKDHPLLNQVREYSDQAGEAISLARQGISQAGQATPLQQGIAIASQPGEWLPVLRGGVDIRPYSTPVGQHWIARGTIRKSLERYFTPKLLIVKSAGRLQAALDLHNHVVLQTLYTLYLRSQQPTQGKQTLHEKIQAQQQEDELYFLLALLNSRLLEEYVYILHTAYKWVQPQIEQHVLAQLPIPISVNMDEKSLISKLARQLMYTCNQKDSSIELKNQYNELYEEQERAICALYTAALVDEVRNLQAINT